MSAHDAADGDRDRLSALRIGVLSSVAALVGVVFGGLFSYLIAVHQTNSQADEDRSTFVRTQRQAVYARFAGDDYFLYNRLRTLLGGDAIPTGPVAREGLDRATLKTLFDNLTLDYQSVSDIGSKEAWMAARNEWSHMNSSVTDIALGDYCLSSAHRKCAASEAVWLEFRKTTFRYGERFRRVVRRDLGSDS